MAKSDGKDGDMQTQTSTQSTRKHVPQRATTKVNQPLTVVKLPPIPETQEIRTLQAEVNKALFTRVMEIAKQKKHTIRQVTEWGLVAYIAQEDPAEAEKFYPVLQQSRTR